MRIRLLGTGAADGIPGLYSNTRVSRYARLHGGKDVRSRAAALVDDVLKLDLPPDTMTQINREGLDARDWTAIVFTHSHDDHFAVEEIQYALYPFNENEYLPFTLYGNAAIIAGIDSRYPEWPIERVETESFVPVKHLDYTVTPFRAQHKEDEDSQNLLIQKNGKTLIYATDTGIWEEETWDFLRGFKADALVIECTDAFRDSGYCGHLDFNDCLLVVDRLRKLGVLSRESQVVTTHHSHQGDGTHEELVGAFAPHRIEPGYDGMIIDI